MAFPDQHTYLSENVFLPIAVLVIVFSTATVIALGSIWLTHRARIKTIEVLKIYAEKGQEPPAGVLEAIAYRAGVPPQPRQPTRGDHLSHVAGSVGLAIGAAGVAWWRAPEPHANPSPLMVFAVIVAIFFTAAAAARLAAALTTRDGRG